MTSKTDKSIGAFIRIAGRLFIFIAGLIYLCHAAALTFSPDYREWLLLHRTRELPLIDFFFYPEPFEVLGVFLILAIFPYHWLPIKTYRHD